MNFFEDSKGNMKLEINDPENSELVVVFGARGSKPNYYSFYKTLSTLGKNVLYLNDSRSGWFTNPLDWLDSKSVWAGIKEFYRILNNIIDENDFKSVVFLGLSMGAYGAFLFRSRYALSKHINFKMLLISLEYKLGSNFSQSRQNIEDINFLSGADDLLDLGLKSDMNSSLYYGELDLYDSLSALKLYEKGLVTNLHSFSGANHFLVEYVHSNFKIKDFFTTIWDGKCGFPQQGRMHDFLNAADLEMIYIADTNSDFYYDTLLSAVNKYSGFAYGWNRLGVIKHNSGELDEAYDFLRKSHFAAPDFGNTLLHLSIVSEKLGKLDESFLYAYEGYLKSGKNKVFSQRVNFLKRKLTILS